MFLNLLKYWRVNNSEIVLTAETRLLTRIKSKNILILEQITLSFCTMQLQSGLFTPEYSQQKRMVWLCLVHADGTQERCITLAFSNLEKSVEMELIGFRLCFRDGFKPILAFCNSRCFLFGIAEFFNHYNKPQVPLQDILGRILVYFFWEKKLVIASHLHCGQWPWIGNRRLSNRIWRTARV